MLLFKSCPRCRGDMHKTRDMYGEYKECLMCGHMIDIPREVPNIVLPKIKRGRKKKAKAA